MISKQPSIAEIFEYIPDSVNLIGFPSTEVLTSLQRFFECEVLIKNPKKNVTHKKNLITPSFPPKFIKERQDFFSRIRKSKRIQKDFFDKNLPKMNNIRDYDSSDNFLYLCDEIYRILNTAESELNYFKYLPETKNVLSQLKKFDSKLELMLNKLKSIEDIRTFAIDTREGIIASIPKLPSMNTTKYKEMKKNQTQEWEYKLFEEVKIRMKKEVLKITKNLDFDFKQSIINYAKEQFRLNEEENLRKSFEKLALPIRMYTIYNKFLEEFEKEPDLEELAELEEEFDVKPGLILPDFGREYNIKGLFPPKLMSRWNKESVVPIYFKSKPSEKKFLISGLHSGGKSFLLENIILLSIIGQAGFYIPADSLTLPKYKNIFYYRNVENQSREGKFDSELKAINSIVHRAGTKDLVVIDEFLDSTTADVSAALGLEILDRLMKSESTVFVTSHRSTNYEQLADKGWILLSPEHKIEDGEIKPTWTLTRGPPDDEITKQYALQKYKDAFG
ncbi:MAG: hypothetical protein PHF86_11065 [Candidatus Nanoarchaeia archaeon]|nr:hypothetical protein [Candidatus Nanoarchaeia archaeon]